MGDIRKDKYDFGKVIKRDREGGDIEVGVGGEVLVGWEDLGKVKEVWGKAGD
ncbi:hypothetical protein [Staphylococcus epidermidis]|uniref:hypothetical protein n=1 Tax=Staphylococcus epidermidis TaxID=1282 RepID=UPI0016432078